MQIFTRRELEVIKLLVDGAKNKEIAKGMNVSLKTVQCYVTSILSKAKMKDRCKFMAAYYKGELKEQFNLMYTK